MSEYRETTDEAHQIELPSTIERVEWTRLRAAPGGMVGLQVFTRYVGNGARLQIKLSDKQGRTHGTFKDQLYANRLAAEIQVPPKAEEALFAEVKLSKHGLSETSPALLITPPVEVRNVRWGQDEARRGDVLTLSADVEGAPDGMEAQIQIFEHDEDGAHDLVTRLSVLVEGEKIEAGWEYEYHEDTDDIPTDEEVEQGYRPPEYFFRVEVEGVAEDSDLLTFKDWIDIELTDRSGQPLPEERYIARLPDGRQMEGTLDQQGKATIEEVPPGRVKVQFPNFGEVTVEA